MKIGIICAGDDELAPFLSEIEDPDITERAMLKFYEENIYGIPVVALYSGVCKVKAAIAAQILIVFFEVDLVINAGTAGGMSPKLKIFDTVISTEVCYHDVAQDILTEFHPWLENVFFKADPKLLKLSETAVNKTDRKGNVYWLPRMEQNEYNLISFQSEAYTDHARLSIQPEPDTVIRVFMAYKPLDHYQEIPEQPLSAPERSGFTVVEWGGSEFCDPYFINKDQIKS